MALLSETNLKPHERLFIPNYHVYQTDRFLGSNGESAFAVTNGILHVHIDPPPLVSVEATWVWKLTGNSKIVLAAINKCLGLPAVMQVPLRS